MELSFVKISPTQNMTILVKTPVIREDQPDIANRLMRCDSVFAEQVGFIEPPQTKAAWARLQMMGGEFCGNAAMSLAAYLVFDKKEPAGAELNVPIEVSGADGVIECLIRVKEDSFTGTVCMPPPEKIGTIKSPMDNGPGSLSVVSFPGITHVLLPVKDAGDDPRVFAGALVRALEPCIEADAYGVILYGRNQNAVRIDPLVRVKSSNSTVWERGCGSGTAAVGSYLAACAGKSITTEVSQPGGIITADVSVKSGAVTDVRVFGEIRIAAQGIAYL